MREVTEFVNNINTTSDLNWIKFCKRVRSVRDLTIVGDNSEKLDGQVLLSDFGVPESLLQYFE